MSVSTKKSVEENANNRRRLGVGVHKATFDRGEMKEVGSNGKKLIEVWFADLAGTSEQKKTIWLPSDQPYVPEGKSLEKAIEDDQARFTDALVDILKAYFPPEKQVLSAPDYDTLAEKFLKQLSTVKKIPVYTLVHWDKEYEYTEFPKYGWIEPVIEGSSPNFDTESKYVRMHKPNNNPYGGIPMSDTTPPPGEAGASDDLPF